VGYKYGEKLAIIIIFFVFVGVRPHPLIPIYLPLSLGILDIPELLLD
jgi:hypothetical protein